MGVEPGVKRVGARRRGRRRAPRPGWRRWAGPVLEALALVIAALVATIAVLGRLAGRLAGTGLWSHLLPFAAVVLATGVVAALLVRGWLALRPWLAARRLALPTALA